MFAFALDPRPTVDTLPSYPHFALSGFGGKPLTSELSDRERC
jgi:hypothetical protein